jgi:hypothetical protein
VSDDLTRDVADVVRRLLLDHAHARLNLAHPPAAGPVGVMGIHTRYFEVTIDGRTFFVMVREGTT